MSAPTRTRPVHRIRRAQPRLVHLSVIIPAYNEEHRLGRTLASILRVANHDWEIIVADDGSTDRTAELVEQLADPRVRVLSAPENKGKGHAVRRGIAASHGRRVLYCDADEATPIEEFAILGSELDHGFAAAIGSRAGQKSRVTARQHPARVLLGWLGNRLIRLLAVPRIADTQCGFKMFDGDKARFVFAQSRIDGFGFDVEILHLFDRYGWPVAEVPVRWAHQPGSKVRSLDYPRVLADVVRVRLTHRGKLA